MHQIENFHVHSKSNYKTCISTLLLLYKRKWSWIYLQNLTFPNINIIRFYVGQCISFYYIKRDYKGQDNVYAWTWRLQYPSYIRINKNECIFYIMNKLCVYLKVLSYYFDYYLHDCWSMTANILLLKTFFKHIMKQQKITKEESSFCEVCVKIIIKIHFNIVESSF